MRKKRLTVRAATLCIWTMLSVSGCSTDATSGCWYEPISTSRADVLTRATENQIVGNNLAWERNGCGRLPVRK
jgi:hypothetical protein